MMYGRRPLTRLEAGIYAALVGVFLAIFAQQMLAYMESAERAAMQATLINATNAINVRLAASYRDHAGPSDWTNRNPFELAGMSPPNFARDVAPGLLESGQWTYDAVRSELVYAPRLRSNLITAEGERLLRFHLVRGPVGYSLEPNAWFAWE